MSEGPDVGSRIERLEELAETLEDGGVGPETATELQEEADGHLEALREALDVGDRGIIPIDVRSGSSPCPPSRIWIRPTGRTEAFNTHQRRNYETSEIGWFEVQSSSRNYFRNGGTGGRNEQ